MDTSLAFVITVFMICVTGLIIFLVQRHDQKTIQELKSEHYQYEARLETLFEVISKALRIDYTQTPDSAIIKKLIEKFNIHD